MSTKNNGNNSKKSKMRTPTRVSELCLLDDQIGNKIKLPTEQLSAIINAKNESDLAQAKLGELEFIYCKKKAELLNEVDKSKIKMESKIYEIALSYKIDLKDKDIQWNLDLVNGILARTK